jgi:hypothetical protein
MRPVEDAVLDQHVALRGAALVVDLERAAPVGQGAVVEHSDALGRDALADLAGENRRRGFSFLRKQVENRLST